MKGEGCSDVTIDSVVSIEYWLLLQSIDTNYYSEKSAHPRSVTFFKVTVLIQAFSEVIRSEIIQSLLLNQTVSTFGDLELETTVVVLSDSVRNIFFMDWDLERSHQETIKHGFLNFPPWMFYRTASHFMPIFFHSAHHFSLFHSPLHLLHVMW